MIQNNKKYPTKKKHAFKGHVQHNYCINCVEPDISKHVSFFLGHSFTLRTLGSHLFWSGFHKNKRQNIVCTPSSINSNCFVHVLLKGVSCVLSQCAKYIGLMSATVIPLSHAQAHCDHRRPSTIVFLHFSRLTVTLFPCIAYPHQSNIRVTLRSRHTFVQKGASLLWQEEKYRQGYKYKSDV